MAWTRAAVGLVAVAAVGLVLVSGGSSADPRTPAALPGMPPPFLGTAVAGSGGLTAAVDAYGDVVDLRPEPAGRALIDNPSARQVAGTVAADTGIVPRLRIGTGPALPLWRADSVSQSYLRGTNAVRTVARFGSTRVVVLVAALGDRLAVLARGDGQARASLSTNVVADSDWSPCTRSCGGLIEAAIRGDRSWLARARPLGPGAPGWAKRMYGRSLLVLHALTDPRTGAVAAGARDGWAYVWPRDAATAALALEAAGYRPLARHVARQLLGLDPSAAARFRGRGEPVPGRGPQGDAAGWIAAAAHAAGIAASGKPARWRNRPDYQEAGAGDYLGNAIAASALSADVSDLTGSIGPVKSDTPLRTESRSGAWIARSFGTAAGLVRRTGDPESGLDSAAAWAVRPFPLPALFPAVRRTLLHLAADQTRFGITPGAGWSGGVDPWSAPTAWTAWAFAALANSEASPAAAREDRRQALRLLADLRRAATPAGSLPERVDAQTGVPRSTTPLAWPHAFAILALRELWPASAAGVRAGASG